MTQATMNVACVREQHEYWEYYWVNIEAAVFDCKTIWVFSPAFMTELRMFVVNISSSRVFNSSIMDDNLMSAGTTVHHLLFPELQLYIHQQTHGTLTETSTMCFLCVSDTPGSTSTCRSRVYSVFRSDLPLNFVFPAGSSGVRTRLCWNCCQTLVLLHQQWSKSTFFSLQSVNLAS